jgi:HEAT repeat protein
MDPSTEEQILDAHTRLYGRDAADSRRAALELAEIGPAALSTLMGALDEPRLDPGVRDDVLYALWILLTARAPAPLLPAADAAKLLPRVMRFLNPEVAGDACSRTAVHVLQAIGDPAVAPLLERARKVGNVEWRYCRRALANLPSGSLVPAVVALLREPDGDLRIRLCDVLERTSLSDHADLVASAMIELLGETDSYVRAAAARVLGKLGPAALPLLMPLTKSHSPVLRAAGLQAIAEGAVRQSAPNQFSPTRERSDNRGVLSLLAEMLNDGDSSVRIVAATELHRVATATAQSQLDQELSAEDSESRLLATRSYRAQELGPGVWGIRALAEQVVHAEDFRLRRQSAATLLACGEATSDDVLETVRQGLLDPEDPSRDGYLVAAQRGGYWSAPLIPAIVNYLRPDDRLCQRAIETIAAIGVATDEAVDRLIDCLQRGKDSQVREAAAKALGRLAPPRPDVVAALVAALNDSEAGEAACHALGAMRQAAAAAIPDIEAAVHHGYRVPESLARIRTPQAIAALWRLYHTGYGGYGDHVSRTDQQDLYDRTCSELIKLGELPDPSV